MNDTQARSGDEAVIRTPAGVTTGPLDKRRQSWVLAACVLGSSMAFIDSSVVNVALPKMESELQTTLAYMTWVINAYTLCMSALLLIGGAAADQIGRRRIFMIGITIFSIASIGCGIAPTVEMLILARAVQGVGAALLIPCSLAIIGAAFGEKERGAAIGIWSGASAIAAGSSPLLGGWLVDHVSWRAIFLINPVIALPTILIALRHVPESIDVEAKKGLDGAGAALAFFGLGSLVYGLIAASERGWSSPIVLGAILLGLVLLVAFVAAERRSPTPMMPLNVFQSLTFSGVNILTLLLYGALGGMMFFLPFLLIQVHGYTATEAGAAFLPFTIILGMLDWPGLARAVRSKLLSLREEDFVKAAELLGASKGRIIARHLIPNFMSHLIASATLSIPSMILGETALSFLGLGLRPPVTSWGVLLNEAQNLAAVQLHPWLLFPIIPVIVVVLAFNFMGDGLRDAADPYH